MTDAVHPPARGTPADSRMAGALAVVLLIGLVIRAQATLVPPLVVGEDGAYYLIQVRAVLRGGTLAYPDFPLLFYFQASVAGLLSLVMEQRAAIVAAVRWTDTFLPLALAVPVHLFARTFVRAGDSRVRGPLAVLLVGLVATASGNSLLMAGGMIKNAAALPTSLLFAFYLFEWLREGRRRTLFAAALWFALASLTHMSGLVLSATVGLCLVSAGLLTPALRGRALPSALGLLCGLVSVLVVVHALDPARGARLVHTVVAPGWLFAGSPLLSWLRGVPDATAADALASGEILLGNALGLLGVITVWRLRAGMAPSTRALLAATSVATLVLSSPLLRPDVLERLALVAFVPGMVPALFLACRASWGSALVAPVTMFVVLHGALAVKTLRVTSLVPPAHADLERLTAALPPGRSIVITRPMLAWWVVWTMDTHSSNRVGRALADRVAYDAVLVLDEIRSGAFGVAHGPAALGALGSGVRDAARLRTEVVTTLAEGAYFRLSVVAKGPPP